MKCLYIASPITSAGPRRMIRRHILLFVWLAGASTLRAAPYISEFMASNQTGIQDQFGARPDWIEITNPDGAAVSLGGWYLTDNASNLTKWRFPAVSVPAHGALLVYASGRSTPLTNGEVHASFQLDKDGEYLALVASNGTTVVSAYSPTYPPQYPDVSYGFIPGVGESTNLLDIASPCRALVPTVNPGTAWTDPSYDDSSWIHGSFAVGFFTNASPDLTAELGIDVRTQMYRIHSSLLVRAPFEVADTSKVDRLDLRLKFDDGFALFLNGQWILSSNALPAHLLSNTSIAISVHNIGNFETLALDAAIPHLRNGTNWMAVQLVNRYNTSSDLFFQPRLVATEASTNDRRGYLSVATPGVTNGGPEVLRLPQTVTFAMPSGIYTNDFVLTLSGVGDGQMIRFTTNSLVPTTNSQIYAGPIAVSTSLHVRARVFATNGQSGVITTAQYTFADPDVRPFRSNLPLLLLRNVDPGQPGSVLTQITNVSCHAFLVEPGSNGETAVTGPAAIGARCGMNVRGKSSAGFAKKPYALEFWSEEDRDEDFKVLGMPRESDWSLIGCYNYDRTYIYNALAFELGRQLGQWAPDGRWVEVFWSTNATINLASNQYAGLYYLCEKIKISGRRIDLPELDPWETSVPECTGGYIIKIDQTTADEDEFSWTTGTTRMGVVLSDPFRTNLVPQQITYITNYVQRFENALNAVSFTNPATGYAAYIDGPTWIDHHWVNLLSKNPDSLRLSAYMTKDRGERIVAGPLWDFDRCFSSYDPRSTNAVEWFASGGTDPWGYGWWKRLFADPGFRQAHIDRWQELRGNVFATTNLMAIVDRYAAQIGTNAATRDYSRWNMWPSAAHGSNYPGEIAYLKAWISNRVAWTDAQFTARPVISPAPGIVAAGTPFTLSGVTGTVVYTTDGSDPRRADGSLNPAAQVYSGAVPIPSTARVTVRALAGTNWSGAATALYMVDEACAGPGDLAIGEIHYRPLGSIASERAARPEVMPRHFEYLEIVNVATGRVNLDGVQLAEGAPASAVTLAPLSLAPGGRAIVVSDRRAFEARHGTYVSHLIAGEWNDGELSDSGEKLTLLSREGALIRQTRYKDSGPWPGRADGRGSSLEFAGPDWTDAALSNASNWRSSSEIHGSPGAEGLGPDRRVAINEILAHTDLPFVDALELMNPGTGTVAIGGWYLGDVVEPETEDSFRQYAIPAGTSLAPGAFAVFDETDFAPNGEWNPSAGTPEPWEFRLDGAHGEAVSLIETGASGRPHRFVDRLEFGATLNGRTIGRWPDGTGTVFHLSLPTLVDAASPLVPRPGAGAPNAPPRVGDVVIAEAHPAPTGPGQVPFIELWNTGTNVEDLAHWTLRGDVDIDFAGGPQLAPGGRLVLVPFAPSDIAASNSFRSAYGVEGPLWLAGPWPTNDAPEAAGRIALHRADEPPVEEPGFHPQVLEDEVKYTNAPPWPDGFAGAGLSLNRRDAGLRADLAASWRADIPSPGASGPSFAGWTNATGAGAAGADDDGDGEPNLVEYATGGDPAVPDREVSGLQVSLTPSGLDIRFHEALDRPGADPVVQRAGQIAGPWEDVPDSVVSNLPGFNLRSATLPPPAGGTNLFLRLRARTP
jgi:hypothetical protein